MRPLYQILESALLHAVVSINEMIGEEEKRTKSEEVEILKEELMEIHMAMAVIRAERIEELEEEMKNLESI